MSAPTPAEIFHRAAAEGKRRLDQSLLELVSGSFIAGFTIVFGIVALGIAHALTEPLPGKTAKVVGALAFAIGLVFLIVGRTELFSENFSDPIAAAFADRKSKMVRPILRLWAITFVLNLAGGMLFALPFSVDGVLPDGTAHAMTKFAEELAARGAWAGFISAVVGGALVALLAFFLQGTNSVASRIVLAYFVGFILALGPFDHVIVTVLHVFFGILFGASVDYGTFFTIMATATAGNLVGGVGLVAFTHMGQAKGAEKSEEQED